MQSHYGMERSIQERTQEARALAELQALRRRALAERRAERLGLPRWLVDLLPRRERAQTPTAHPR